MGRESHSSKEFPTCQYSKPHKFEKLLEQSGMNIIKTESHQYPMCLSLSHDPSTQSFDIASLPVRGYLSALVSSGEKPFAFEDAKSAFDDILKEGLLLRTDSSGRDVIHENRFETIIARRRHDIGTTSKSKTKNEMRNFQNKVKVLYPSNDSSVKEVHRMFDLLLVDTFQTIVHSPITHIERHISKASRLSTRTDGKKYVVLDLASQPSSMINDIMKQYPAIDFCLTNFSSDQLERIVDYKPKFGMETIFHESSFGQLENESIDMAICFLGLPFFQDIHSLIKEVYRVLKPGGRIIVSKWESLSLERIADALEEEFVNEYSYDQIPFKIFSDHVSLSAPGCVENLLESHGLSVIETNHDEFPFVLNGEGILDEKAVQTSTLSIQPVLRDYVETNIYPSAFEDVKRSIDKLIRSSQLLNIDGKGRLVTVPNRIKTIAARKTC